MDVHRAAVRQPVPRVRDPARHARLAMVPGVLVGLLVTAAPAAWAVMVVAGALGWSMPFHVAGPIGLVVAVLPLAAAAGLCPRDEPAPQ